MAETSYIIQNGRRLNLKDSTARKQIGSCDELQTDTKHCLVMAINELNQKVGAGGGGGAPGKDGEDGVSCTHEWNGTVLTVTSASGTSSADLKGSKGDRGDTGPQGPQGPAGQKGDAGPRGESGVYVGSGDMPDGYNVQIDPGGDSEPFPIAVVADVLPEASETLRGSFAIVPNGDTDNLYICMRVAGVYGWVVLNASGTSGGGAEEDITTTSVLGRATLGTMILGG